MSGRALTRGEVTVAQTIFGHAIDYARARVHKGKYIFFQPANTAMTPNGEIYFPDGVYKTDYSTTLGDASWLIHELTHVWQYQQGMWVRLRASLNRRYDYGKLDRGRAFTAYSLEQQASIVADYYNLLHNLRPQHGGGAVGDYQAVIPFLPRRG